MRRLPQGQSANHRKESLRSVFCVDSRFDGMAAHTDIALRYSQLQARSHLKLLLNEVYACGHLCHRVLDLQSGVHF